MEGQDVALVPAPAPAATDPPSPSHSYDDIEALVAWPALEQFMEDLSDLDEQGNIPERPEPLPMEVRGDPLGSRDRSLSQALFGPGASFPQRSMQHPLTQQLLPTSHYLPWQSLNLPFNRGGGSTNSLSSVLSADRPMHRSDSLHSIGGGCSSCAASSSSHSLQPQVC